MSLLSSGSKSSADFVQNIFSAEPKPIFFWDTCSLLEIIRLVYRGGNLNSLKSIIEIKGLIDSGAIYSICSELTIKEWNDNFDHIKSETQKSLNLTSIFHKDGIDMINHIFSTTYSSDHTGDKGLVAELEKIADGICQSSIFLTTDSIAQNALTRVKNKLPPSAKKPEFKDCAIWETVLDLASQVQFAGLNFVFLTVNTDDYVDKGRTPRKIHGNLISEAVTYNVDLELTFEQARLKI
jgi:hypothetical protein